jgi:hypothetical protein
MEQTVVERLERLERQNGRLRALAGVIIVSAFVFMAIGFAPKKAVTAETSQDNITTRQIGIVDAAGNVRIALGVDEETGPVITRLSKKGDPVVSIGVVDKDGSAAISLSGKNDKAGLTLFTASDGTSGMIVDDNKGITRAMVGVGPDGTPVVSLNDAADKVTASMAVAGETPRISLADKDGNTKVIEPGK